MEQIFVIATKENKADIIPFLQSKGGINRYNYSAETIIVDGYYYVAPHGFIKSAGLPIAGYQEEII